MQLNTKNFATIEINEEGIISFPEGLPGFELVRRFVLLGNTEEQHPFQWLQSVDNPDLAFVVVNPFDIVTDYDFNIGDDVEKKLEIEKQEDLLIRAIVVIPEDISRISMNLKAPVIINNKNKKGIQLVLDTDKYSVRHYILEELQGQEVKDHAGSDKEKR